MQSSSADVLQPTRLHPHPPPPFATSHPDWGRRATATSSQSSHHRHSWSSSSPPPCPLHWPSRTPPPANTPPRILHGQVAVATHLLSISLSTCALAGPSPLSPLAPPPTPCLHCLASPDHQLSFPSSSSHPNSRMGPSSPTTCLGAATSKFPRPRRRDRRPATPFDFWRWSGCCSRRMKRTSCWGLPPDALGF
jgi:hypothetical protein